MLNGLALEDSAGTEGGGGARRRERLKIKRSWTLFAPLGVCALLAGWIALSAANVQADDFSILLYGLANLIVFTDAIDFGLRLYVHRRHTAVASDLGRGEMRQVSIDLAAARSTGAVTVRPYAIVASIFNLEDHLEEFMERLQPYRDHVWLISDGSTDNTAKRLRQAGWRCLDDDVNRHKPGALRRLLLDGDWTQRYLASIQTAEASAPRACACAPRPSSKCVCPQTWWQAASL